MRRGISILVLALGLTAGLLVAFDVISLGGGGARSRGAEGPEPEYLSGYGDETEAGLRGRKGARPDEELTAAPSPGELIPSEVRGTTRNGAAVYGRVVTGAGAVPIAGTMVNLIRQDSLFHYFRAENNGRFDLLTARTGTDGRFAFLDVTPADSYVVRARKDPYAHASSDLLDLRGAERKDIGDLELTAGGGLKGRVLDANDEPVADVRVACSWGIMNPFGAVLADPETLPEIERETKTDAQGTFELERLEPGSKTVLMKAPSGATAVIRRIEIEDGVVRKAEDVKLVNTQVLAGRVQWVDGAPIVDARVYAGAGQEAVMRSDETDADGRFRIEWLPDAPLAVGIVIPGLPVRVEFGTQPGREDVVFEFPLAGGIRGRVVTADEGTPVPKFSIQVDPQEVADFEQQFVHNAVSKALGPTVFANRDGAFELPRLEARKYVLRVKAPGYPEIRKENVEVVGGAVTDGVVIEMPSGNVARGIVLRANGEPLAEARIHAVLGGIAGDLRQARALVEDREPDGGTRSDGTFVLPPQAPGRYDIVATYGAALPGIARGLDLGLGDVEGVEIRMPPSGGVRVLMLGESGRPAKGERGYVLYPNGTFIDFEADDEGRHVLEGLPVGSCVVRWLSMRDVRRYRKVMEATDAEAKRAAYEELRAEGGEHYVADASMTPITIRLPGRVKLRGHIRVAGEPPKPGTPRGVWMTIPEGGFGVWIECNAEGYYERELEAGLYVAWIPGSEGKWLSTEIDVPDAGTHTQDFERD